MATRMPQLLQLAEAKKAVTVFCQQREVGHDKVLAGRALQDGTLRG